MYNVLEPRLLPHDFAWRTRQGSRTEDPVKGTAVRETPDSRLIRLVTKTSDKTRKESDIFLYLGPSKSVSASLSQVRSVSRL
jgi:hypothetical protein